MPAPVSLPYAPRRILVGASDPSAVMAGLHAARPDLELRGGPHATLTAADVAWAEVYVGFRRPPVNDMGAVRWVHSTGAGVDPWLAPAALDPDVLLTRSPQSFGPAIAEWALARVLAFTQRLPELAAARGVVSRAVLARCRGAVLLNAGRGAAVEESAVPEALDQGWLRGAALDVFVTEPLPATSPLWRDPRVIISPHCSGPTMVEGAVQGFLECLTTLERGAWPRWVIDRAKGY